MKNINVRETKCYAPLHQSLAGAGDRGGIRPLGEYVALGNVEEELIRVNRGFAERGVHGEQWDYATGRGYVAAHKGEYHHCTHVLKHTLLLLVSETFGGLSHDALCYLRTLDAKAGKAGCPDRTKYGDRARKLTFFEHYARRLSAAAIIGDAHVTHKIEDELRQRLARAHAARTLDALQVELMPAQTPESLAAWPPLPTQVGLSRFVVGAPEPTPATGAESA